jgi:hypothetical protein
MLLIAIPQILIPTKMGKHRPLGGLGYEEKGLKQTNKFLIIHIGFLSIFGFAILLPGEKFVNYRASNPGVETSGK